MNILSSLKRIFNRGKEEVKEAVGNAMESVSVTQKEPSLDMVREEVTQLRVLFDNIINKRISNTCHLVSLISKHLRPLGITIEEVAGRDLTKAFESSCATIRIEKITDAFDGAVKLSEVDFKENEEKRAEIASSVWQLLNEEINRRYPHLYLFKEPELT